jgi:hypothetical protein
VKDQALDVREMKKVDLVFSSKREVRGKFILEREIVGLFDIIEKCLPL